MHATLLFLPAVLLSILAAPPPQWTLLRTLLVSYATYLSTLVSSIIVYRVSPIHPLAQYPGPIGCKVSKFWMGFICIPGYQHQYIKALHERYGDVVRIGTCIGRLPLWGISIWGTGCSIAEQGVRWICGYMKGLLQRFERIYVLVPVCYGCDVRTARFLSTLDAVHVETQVNPLTPKLYSAGTACSSTRK